MNTPNSNPSKPFYQAKPTNNLTTPTQSQPTSQPITRANDKLLNRGVPNETDFNYMLLINLNLDQQFQYGENDMEI